MKAYFVDLRPKIAETYETGGVTQRELAKRFLGELVFCHYSVGAVANQKDTGGEKARGEIKAAINAGNNALSRTRIGGPV